MYIFAHAGQESPLAAPPHKVNQYDAHSYAQECTTYQFARLGFCQSVTSFKGLAMAAHAAGHKLAAMLPGQMEQVGKDACDMYVSMAARGAHISGCAYLWIHYGGVVRSPSNAQLRRLVVGITLTYRDKYIDLVH